jgi:hypothetical protein
LIISVMRDGDTNGLDFFKESEIQDTDDDGIPEIVDGWGVPINFLRWAPGFYAAPGNDGGWGIAGVDDDGANGVDDFGEQGWPNTDDELISDIHNRDTTVSPDPFDPLKVDPRWTADNNPYNDPYALYPLIYSAGPDQEEGIAADYDTDSATLGNQRFRYAKASPFPNDPYHVITTAGGGSMFGFPDVNNTADLDNITNHVLGDN